MKLSSAPVLPPTRDASSPGVSSPGGNPISPASGHEPRPRPSGAAKAPGGPERSGGGEVVPSAPRTGTILPSHRKQENRRLNASRPSKLSLVPLSKNWCPPQGSCDRSSRRTCRVESPGWSHWASDPRSWGRATRSPSRARRAPYSVGSADSCTRSRADTCPAFRSRTGGHTARKSSTGRSSYAERSECPGHG